MQPLKVPATLVYNTAEQMNFPGSMLLTNNQKLDLPVNSHSKQNSMHSKSNSTNKSTFSPQLPLNALWEQFLQSYVYCTQVSIDYLVSFFGSRKKILNHQSSPFSDSLNQEFHEIKNLYKLLLVANSQIFILSAVVRLTKLVVPLL